MPADLETIVQRMIDAGEPEENIATVIQHYRQPEGDRGTSGGGMLAALAAKAAPLATRAVNAGTAGASRLASSRLTPAVIAGSVMNDLGNGDVTGAARTAAASATAGYVLPKVAGAITRATAPQTAATRDAIGRFTSIGRAAGPVARAASAVSKAAGPIGLATEAIFGEGRAGHRPPNETPATTAHRQTDFAHQFKDQVNREAGYEVITGSTTEAILDSIAKYRGAR